MKRLAIIATHPIQYNAPWFALLAKESEVEFKVFYTWSQKQVDGYDPDFKINIAWDIPLLEGYDHTFVPNTAKRPGAHHFMGIVCPLLIEEIEQWGATHLLVFGWNYHAHLTTMRHFKGKIPVWFRGDSTLLDYDIQMFSTIRLTHLVADGKQYGKFLLRKLFLTWVYRHVDKAFYVGQNNKAYYQAHGLKEQQLVFAPHAIDNERFFDGDNKGYENRAKIRRSELGYGALDFVVLFCGKLESKKNPLLLVDCFKKLKVLSNNRNVKLLIVGNGILEAQLRSTAEGDCDIQFLPFQNQTEMPVVYRIADLYCLPSQGPGETWGLAVNEALACGRPVLVSHKVGCAADLVNEQTGVVFQSGNQKDLLSLLSRLVNHQYDFTASAISSQVQTWSFDSIVASLLYQLND